ncbi:hypothetical protein ILUMI_19899, partial [Ignelater luminosus]
AMPSLSDTGGISNISPCLDAFPIIPDLDLLLVISKNPEVRAIALDEFLENPSIVVANNNLEIIDEDEDSDDAIKDKDYHYEPGETSDSDGMTVTLMHKLYKEQNPTHVSLPAYGKIFHKEFNLKTKISKEDTCNKCDSYQVKIQNITSNNEENQNVTSEHNRHLEQTELARKQMNSDLKIATVTENLWLYNCGLHTGKDNKSTFNIWLEGHAGREAQEVGSCMRKYVVNHISDKIQELILWSDSCGGQNRNIKIVLLLKSILEEKPTLEKIRLKFLVSGRSLLPNDSSR